MNANGQLALVPEQGRRLPSRSHRWISLSDERRRDSRVIGASHSFARNPREVLQPALQAGAPKSGKHPDSKRSRSARLWARARRAFRRLGGAQ